MGQIRHQDDNILLGKAYDSTIARRLTGFLKPHMRQVWLVTLFVVLNTGADLVLPILFSLAIDEVDTEQRMWVLNVIGISYIVVVLLRFLFSWAQFYYAQWLGNRVVLDIRNTMFRHLQGLSIGYIDRRGVGSVMTRIQNDVAVIQSMFTDTLLGIISNVLVLVGIVVIMLITNWKMALLAFTVMPLMVLIMRYLAAVRESRLPDHAADDGDREREPRREHRRDAGRAGLHPRAGEHDLVPHDQRRQPEGGGRCRQVFLPALPDRRPALVDLDRAGGLLRRAAGVQRIDEPRGPGAVHRDDRPVLLADSRPEPAVQLDAVGDGGG